MGANSKKIYPAAMAEYESKLAEWKRPPKKPRPQGKQPPPAPNPEDQMRGNSRPGNIYNGVLKPTIGYGIRGNLVSGGIQRGQSLSVSRLVPADDQELARRVGPG